ncbi:MAG: M20/M25/M40 family metallo-hydrolase [Ruminococcaceae bacterium]|nr:M20/M25/M40 family metallo-hydrolase [Oscillospiraceae bacterium]
MTPLPPILIALIAVAAALVLFAIVAIAMILIRALTFKPGAQPVVDATPMDFDKDRATETLRTLVRCKTVSYRDPSLEDNAEFEKLIDSLPTLYPNVFSACSMQRLPDRGLLFHWKGKTDGNPAVLMAHYDVVPVNEDAWDVPAFEALIKDGCMWGRGTLDTKVTFNGILFAADTLISQGFVPECDVYFAFSGGEEVNGKGAVHIVDYFEQHKIQPALVLDEGGAVVENVFPGVKVPCAMIGIAEKGMMDVGYTVKSGGGHASAPKPGAPVDRLSAACVRMVQNPFKAKLTPPAAKMFDTLGRYSSFVYKVIFSNIKLFLPVLDLICKKSGGELNALMRTTVAFTQMQGSSASNVIPPEASLVSNIRLNPADDMDSALAYIKKTVDDENVEVTCLHGMNPSRISRTDCAGWDKVASAVASTWKGCIVSPYLMVQCSDSRHWGRISDRVYRFSAMDLTSAERATIHGNNEKIRLETLYRSVEFFMRLIKDC